jgi:hypothetical protein
VDDLNHARAIELPPALSTQLEHLGVADWTLAFGCFPQIQKQSPRQRRTLYPLGESWLGGYQMLRQHGILHGQLQRLFLR